MTCFILNDCSQELSKLKFGGFLNWSAEFGFNKSTTVFIYSCTRESQYDIKPLIKPINTSFQKVKTQSVQESSCFWGYGPVNRHCKSTIALTVDMNFDHNYNVIDCFHCNWYLTTLGISNMIHGHTGDI